jgi:hypothetical protein
MKNMNLHFGTKLEQSWNTEQFLEQNRIKSTKITKKD